ncbi:hypothetical protein [Sphingomonas bacterium]|uniref:hypothetical protein n=1 Tax=Sphingomonas bacterium TaxID=1895847 RepID=UPI001575662C|nr:hypothetical protein [Sphingomonas bacterium]
MVSRPFLALLLPLAVGGCLDAVSTAVHAPFTAVSVAKAPFRAGGKVVDWTTTSQAEADRNSGRRMRKAEEREGRERREWAKHCRGRERASECREYSGFRASG